MRQLIPHKQILEFRTRHRLDFFSKMDSVGLAFLETFSDWKRAATFLQIEDRTGFQRIHLTSDGIVIELDCPREQQDGFEERTLEWAGRIIEMLSWESMTRVGLRRWFAVDVNLTQQALVQRMSNRALTPFSFRNDVTDFHSTFEIGDMVKHEVDAGEGARIILGPMVPKEWTSFVPYVEPRHLGVDGVKKITKTLPDAFVFLDVDTFKFEKSDGFDCKIGKDFISKAVHSSLKSVKELTGLFK